MKKKKVSGSGAEKLHEEKPMDGSKLKVSPKAMDLFHEADPVMVNIRDRAYVLTEPEIEKWASQAQQHPMWKEFSKLYQRGIRSICFDDLGAVISDLCKWERWLIESVQAPATPPESLTHRGLRSPKRGVPEEQVAGGPRKGRKRVKGEVIQPEELRDTVKKRDEPKKAKVEKDKTEPETKPQDVKNLEKPKQGKGKVEKEKKGVVEPETKPEEEKKAKKPKQGKGKVEKEKKGVVEPETKPEEEKKPQKQKQGKGTNEKTEKTEKPEDPKKGKVEKGEGGKKAKAVVRKKKSAHREQPRSPSPSVSASSLTSISSSSPSSASSKASSTSSASTQKRLREKAKEADCYCQLSCIEGYWEWIKDPKPQKFTQEVLAWDCKPIRDNTKEKNPRKISNALLADALQKKVAEAEPKPKRKTKDGKDKEKGGLPVRDGAEPTAKSAPTKRLTAKTTLSPVTFEVRVFNDILFKIIIDLLLRVPLYYYTIYA